MICFPINRTIPHPCLLETWEYCPFAYRQAFSTNVFFMLQIFLSYRLAHPQSSLFAWSRLSPLKCYLKLHELWAYPQCYDTSGEVKLTTTSVMYYQRVKIWLMMIMKWFCGMVDWWDGTTMWLKRIGSFFRWWKRGSLHRAVPSMKENSVESFTSCYILDV